MCSILFRSNLLRPLTEVCFGVTPDILQLTSLVPARGCCWCRNQFDAGVPFGGYKASGIGREKGQAALEHYTQVTQLLLRQL